MLHDRQRSAAQESLGMPPQLASLDSRDPTHNVTEAVQVNGRRSSGTHGRYGMNLPAVAEVLARYGLDPLEEIAQVMSQKVPLRDEKGNPILDDKGNPILKTQLSPVEHAKLAAELMQYTRPKLKAVEVTVKPPELTDEQIEQRLQGLLKRGVDQ